MMILRAGLLGGGQVLMADTRRTFLRARSSPSPIRRRPVEPEITGAGAALT